MKRYSNFSRSFATVSLVVLYSFATFFIPSFASAEEVVRPEVITDPVELNAKLAESFTQEVSMSQEIVESPVEVIEVSQDEVQVLEVEQVSSTSSSDKELLIEDENSAEVLSVVDEAVQSQNEEEVSTISSTNVIEEVVARVTCEGNAPSITLQESYVDARSGGIVSVLNVLAQIQPEAIDPQDGNVAVTDNVASLPFPLTPGWYDINFTATDSDGCVTTETAKLFIVGEEYSPVCESGYAYMRFSIPENLTARLGTGTQVYSGEWFPVMYEGQFLNEFKSEITQDFDVSIVRTGNSLFIDLENFTDPVTLNELANTMIDTIELSGAEFENVPVVFSGAVGFVDFQPTDCPEPPVVVCTQQNNPLITTLVDTVTLEENSGLSVDEVIALFGIEVVDQDGEGEVTFVHTLTQENIATQGTYTITITAIDNEDCESAYSVTLVVEGEDDNGGGGSTGSGCVNPNGCGGGSSNPPQDEPVGEILGEFSGPACEYYISTFLKKGADNPVDQVRKLQIFLNDYMGENLVVDGVYGNATFEAVKRFQIREFDEVLLPWGIDEATGIVRETTMRRINNIMCPELNILMPILYCQTTGQVIYPEGRDLSWLQTSVNEVQSSPVSNVVTDNFGSYDISDISK